jgi:hypothetical protein
LSSDRNITSDDDWKVSKAILSRRMKNSVRIKKLTRSYPGRIQIMRLYPDEFILEKIAPCLVYQGLKITVTGYAKMDLTGTQSYYLYHGILMLLFFESESWF